VTSVNPVLTVIDGVPEAQVAATLQPAPSTTKLLGGMSTDVTVIAAQSKDVLLVPVEALRPLGNGQYAVFVVGSGNQLTLRPVAVGLQDDSFAEIKSGLKLGEVVSTGTVATK